MKALHGDYVQPRLHAGSYRPHEVLFIIGGATVGILVGNLVSHRSSNSKLTFIPFGNSNYQGVKLAYIW